MQEPYKPYPEFKDTPLWLTIEQIVDELISNDDLQLTTHKDLVIGYFCKNLIEKNLIQAQPTNKNR